MMTRTPRFALALALAVPTADAFAVNCSRHPSRCDQDGDSLNDAVEQSMGTDPLDPDTDGDGSWDADDLWPLDGSEWADLDGDGIGDNADPDDDDNGIDDVDQVIGGQPLVELAALPEVFTVTLCPWDMTGPIDALTNPNCIEADVELTSSYTATELSSGATGEWEESLDLLSWSMRLAFPGLETASQRMNGVRVQSGSATACYEGMVETLGGTTNLNTQQTVNWWFDTGRFAGCL
ncbi:MAG: hypothetical protein KC621_17420 [Myxococcales bacterium]|nr:hypothetical protein [Myxococcales bacterium]